jgi:hypothetical protein
MQTVTDGTRDLLPVSPWLACQWTRMVGNLFLFNYTVKGDVAVSSARSASNRLTRSAADGHASKISRILPFKSKDVLVQRIRGRDVTRGTVQTVGRE